MIFSTTGYNGGSWLYRLTNGGRSAELVWHNQMDNQMGGAVKVGDYIYSSSHNNSRGWYCLDVKTGETKWRSGAEFGQSSIIYADGMLYVYSYNGNMYLVKPNPNQLEIVSQFTVTLGTNQHWAHPVIHEGVLYIRHGDALMAYKIKSRGV